MSTFRTKDLGHALELAMRHMVSTDYSPEPVTSTHIYFVDVLTDGLGRPREYVIGDEPREWAVRCTIHRDKSYTFAYPNEVNT